MASVDRSLISGAAANDPLRALDTLESAIATGMIPATELFTRSTKPYTVAPETDYPHSETTWPESRKLLDWQFDGVSEEEMRPIVRDNARRFYWLA